jgi:hypothetical protein
MKGGWGWGNKECLGKFARNTSVENSRNAVNTLHSCTPARLYFVLCFLLFFVLRCFFLCFAESKHLAQLLFLSTHLIQKKSKYFKHLDQ